MTLRHIRYGWIAGMACFLFSAVCWCRVWIYLDRSPWWLILFWLSFLCGVVLAAYFFKARIVRSGICFDASDPAEPRERIAEDDRPEELLKELVAEKMSGYWNEAGFFLNLTPLKSPPGRRIYQIYLAWLPVKDAEVAFFDHTPAVVQRRGEPIVANFRVEVKAANVFCLRSATGPLLPFARSEDFEWPSDDHLRATFAMNQIREQLKDWPVKIEYRAGQTRFRAGYPCDRVFCGLSPTASGTFALDRFKPIALRQGNAITILVEFDAVGRIRQFRPVSRWMTRPD